MHWIDLVIIAIIAWSTFTAFSNGLIREVVQFVALIGGLILAGLFYDDLAADTAFLIENETTRNLLSFIAIFAGIAILGQVGAWVLQRVASLLLLGPFDHLGGAVFGFAKAVVFVQVLLIAVAVFPAADAVAAAVDESALAPLFLDSMPMAQRGLPSEFENALQQLQQWRATGSNVLGVTAP